MTNQPATFTTDPPLALSSHRSTIHAHRDCMSGPPSSRNFFMSPSFLPVYAQLIAFLHAKQFADPGRENSRNGLSRLGIGLRTWLSCRLQSLQTALSGGDGHFAVATGGPIISRAAVICATRSFTIESGTCGTQTMQGSRWKMEDGRWNREAGRLNYKLHELNQCHEC